MSDTSDRDLLAAEYVLGCLDADEAQQADNLIASDPAFVNAVETWQRRLTPLSVLVPPVEPPADLWQRIAASTALVEAKVVPLRRLRFWQGGALGALAVAASLAAFIVVRQAAPPPEPPAVAVLMPLAGAPSVLVATSGPDGRLQIRPSGTITVPDNHDLELWALAKGETRPRSLGVLPHGERQLVTAPAADTQLLVSLEPTGGSPTGQPTGPVLYSGRLTRSD